MPSNNQQILEAFLDAFSEGVDKSCEYLTDDATFLQAASLPYPKTTFVGCEGFKELMGSMTQHFELEMHDREYFERGDKVVGVIPILFTSKRTGERTDMTVVEIYTFRDGKISNVDVFYKDPEKIAALA